MTTHATLLHALAHHAATRPDATAFTFVVPGDGGEVSWTFSELHRKAARVAAGISASCEPGSRVLLLYPQGLDYVAALLGCMWAGVLAVPLQPPVAHRAKHELPKLEAIAADGGIELACTVGANLEEMQAVVSMSEDLADLPWLCTDERLPPADLDRRMPLPDELAYLQYTSGSTSTPKGVMVGHDNLMVNLLTFDRGFSHGPDAVMVSWLPTFHDLGLVYGVFMPLYKGFEGVLLDPMDFLRRPMRWLEAIDRHKGTHAPAPNFAFDYLVARSTPEERAALDLSSWKVALNGAEPIRRDTEVAFFEAFSVAGLSPTTMTHAYGMSEATAVISKEPAPTIAHFLWVDGAALEQHKVVVLPDGLPKARPIAGCGVPVKPTMVRAVHPDTMVACAEDEVGELWVGGPTCARGYWARPEDTEEGFNARIEGEKNGGWLRTGDLGFVRGGTVYVTGRLKDIVILRGQNFYPQDLEWSAQQGSKDIRPSCVAAFAEEGAQGETLTIVAEVYDRAEGHLDEVVDGVVERIGDRGVLPDRVVLVKQRSLYKTSSGKIMRRRIREALQEGQLPVLLDRHVDRPAEAPAAEHWTDLATLPELPRRQAVLGRLVEHLQHWLGREGLASDATFRDIGIDSVQAVQLAEFLSDAVGQQLPATLLFEYPQVDLLAAHLADLLPDGAWNDPSATDGDLDLDELAALLDEELENLD